MEKDVLSMYNLDKTISALRELTEDRKTVMNKKTPMSEPMTTPERAEYAEYVEVEGRKSAQNVLRFLGNNIAGWVVSIRTVLGEPDMWFTKQGEESICAPNGSKVYKHGDGFKVVTAQGREYIGLPSMPPRKGGVSMDKRRYRRCWKWKHWKRWLALWANTNAKQLNESKTDD
jgi:hypothetical protein